MIIDVTFLYEASVLAPRKRNGVDTTYLDTVPVEVPDVDGAEAPVAMRWKLSQYDDIGPGQVLELRWHGDRLWRPLYEVTGNHRRPDTEYHVAKRDAEWLVRCAAETHKEVSWGDSSGPFPTGRRSSRDTMPVRIDQDPNVHKVLSSRRDARVAEIAAAAAKMLLVDGVPHVTCPEPVYTISHVGRDAAWLSPTLGFESAERQGPDRVFRADEYEYVMATRHLDETPVGDRIEVLVPEAVRYDGPGRDVIRQAHSVRDWMKARIADRDTGFFEVYAGLRDGLAREEARHNLAPGLDPCATGVVQVARDALDALSFGNVLDDFYKQRLMSALERVDAHAMASEPLPTP